jgi:predicted porin
MCMKAITRLLAVLTVAVPGLAFAQAAAPAPVVQLYGTLNLNLQYAEASGATAGTASNVNPRFAVSTDSSNVGVRGSVDVLHGLKAVYQCETTANADGEGVSGICNRNSRLGVQGTFGTLFFGNWDTPYKAAFYGTKADDPFGNTDVYDAAAIIGSPGFGVRSAAFNNAAAAPNANFALRAANSVAYHSPKIANLASFKLQWSTNEFRQAQGQVAPQLFSGVLNFDMGGLSVAAAAEYHEDAFGIRVGSAANTQNVATTDIGLKAAAGYELPIAGMGAFTIQAAVEQLQYKQDDTTVGIEEFKRLAWQVGAKFRTGNHELRARYSQALEPDITNAAGADVPGDELGATDLAVGYAYHLSKAVQVYAYYTTIMNDDLARYTFATAGPATLVGANTAAGTTLSAGGLGMRAAF